MYERNPVLTRGATQDMAAFDAGLRKHMLRVYNYMASGVLLTGIVAMLVAATPALCAISMSNTVSPIMTVWLASAPVSAMA